MSKPKERGELTKGWPPVQSSGSEHAARTRGRLKIIDETPRDKTTKYWQLENAKTVLWTKTNHEKNSLKEGANSE